MHKRIWLFILLVIFVLAACKSSSQPTPVVSASVEEKESATSAPTRLVVSLPTATATVAVEPSATSTTGTEPGPGCTLISYLPDDPSGALYPEVTQKDWVHGPETAQVTVIEYSDFQ